MPTPALIAAAGFGKSQSLALDPDLALVRLQQPEKYVHQRCLAGAVLADDGVNPSPLDGEAHILVGDKGTKPLGDRLQLDGKRHRRRPYR